MSDNFIEMEQAVKDERDRLDARITRLYGEKVAKRWLDTKISIEADKEKSPITNQTGLGHMDDLARGVNLYEFGQCIGRLEPVVIPKLLTGVYYLVKLIDIPVLYKLTNYTLVPPYLGLPNEFMVEIILRQLNFALFERGEYEKFPISVYSDSDGVIPITLSAVGRTVDDPRVLLTVSRYAVGTDVIPLLRISDATEDDYTAQINTNIGGEINTTYLDAEIPNGIQSFFPNSNFSIQTILLMQSLNALFQQNAL